MGFWSTVLPWEDTLREELAFEDEDEGVLLFDPDPKKGFRPNPGGQQRFFQYYPLQPRAPENLDIARWFLLNGGIGSGKSYCGAIWAVLQTIWYPEQTGIILANSFPQLFQATLVTLAKVCLQYRIYLEPMANTPEETAIKIANLRRCYIGENRTFTRVLSMGSFYGKTQSSRGQQAHWAWVDEGLWSPEQAFLTLDGRLRSPDGAFCRGLITSSPNGFNWGYYRFADPARTEEAKKLFTMISCPTRENARYLGDDYVDSLTINYTDELARQELEGEFINSQQGLTFKYFRRSVHALIGEDADLLAYDPTQPLHLAFDFNYSPAVCTFSQVRQREIHVFYELYLLDSDIWELVDKISEWTLSSKPECWEVFVYGDASGRNRSIYSRETAWDIVFNGLRKMGFRLTRKFGNANPPVRNRVNSANALLKRGGLYIDMNKCPELVKDFEQTTWGGEGLDKADKLRTHLGDAITYQIDTLFPYAELSKPGMGKVQVPGIAG